MSSSAQPEQPDGFLILLIRLIASLFKRAPEAPPPAPVDAPPLPSTISPAAAPEQAADSLTAQVAMELIGHEAIVLEAYKDSKGIWTWGIGVTDASGHNVERYIDHPQSIARCLEIFVWLLRTKYLPHVYNAFEGYSLTEAELAAALSFHYNTGAILSATWVKLWKAGHVAEARKSFMTWNKPAAIVERRQMECDLFFDGLWSNDGKALVIPVSKPSYQPNYRHAARVDVLPTLQVML
jgi:lysozyme